MPEKKSWTENYTMSSNCVKNCDVKLYLTAQKCTSSVKFEQIDQIEKYIMTDANIQNSVTTKVTRLAEKFEPKLNLSNRATSVLEISKETTSSDTIYGESSTVPLKEEKPKIDNRVNCHLPVSKSIPSKTPLKALIKSGLINTPLRSNLRRNLKPLSREKWPKRSLTHPKNLSF